MTRDTKTAQNPNARNDMAFALLVSDAVASGRRLRMETLADWASLLVAADSDPTAYRSLPTVTVGMVEDSVRTVDENGP